MSRTAKTTFALVTVATAGIIYYVHYYQKQTQAVMHQGVIRDEEREKIRKERKAELLLQQQLQSQYEKIQPVSSYKKTEF